MRVGPGQGVRVPSRTGELEESGLPNAQKFKLFKPFKFFNSFARAPVDDCRHRSLLAGVPVTMLRLPTPQKFNTFNTFTTFAMFAIFANINSALKYLSLVYRQAPPARSSSEHTFSTPHPPPRSTGEGGRG
jgi:hypothetical protein